MKEIFEQYGGVIVTVFAIVALVAIMAILFAADDSGIVFSNFEALFKNLFQKIPTT